MVHTEPEDTFFLRETIGQISSKIRFISKHGKKNVESPIFRFTIFKQIELSAQAATTEFSLRKPKFGCRC